ncbi:MAG: hypothetical protein KZQ99_23045 [Candidatus Thiodiazotropha sp. (ex Dulcina madagascariensis)]|nr:hypothetical protein [Candidatus Thiodiazotropha sp. (ex Dulcina madagascariensis)]
MREKEIAHLNGDAEKIRVYLGLKDKPAFISDVKVPVTTQMQIGRIGAQPNFGLEQNSGFQYQLLQEIPKSSFSNTRALSCPHVRRAGILIKQPQKWLIPGCFSGFSASRFPRMCASSPFSHRLRGVNTRHFSEKPRFPADGAFTRPTAAMLYRQGRRQ